MNPMKRLGLTALVVALGALVTASPALAEKKNKKEPDYSTTFQLAPPPDAPEPDASGEWTLDVYVEAVERPYGLTLPYEYECATVSCQRLTPREQYVVRVLVEGGWSSDDPFVDHAVTANGKGTLRAEVWVYPMMWGDDENLTIMNRHIADLWIVKLNEDGEEVVVLETQR